MQPPAELEEEFNAWYDEEHVPARLALPGFVGAVRYRKHPAGPGSGQMPRYGVTYFLEGLAALETPAYRRLKDSPSARSRPMLRSVSGFTRFLAEEAARVVRPGTPAPETAPLLYPVFFSVPPERQKELEAWYDREHIPILMEEPQWRACVRYRIREAAGGERTHLALHYLESSEALRSPVRDRARQTPWRRKLAAEPWFQGLYSLYERIEPPAAWATILWERSGQLA